MSTKFMNTPALTHDEVDRLLHSLSLSATDEDGIPDMDDFARVIGWAWRVRLDHRKRDLELLEAVLTGEWEIRIGPPRTGSGFGFSDPALYFWVHDREPAAHSVQLAA